MNEHIISLSKYLKIYSYYLLFFFGPLVFTPLNSELFEFNKMLLVYFLTSFILFSWLLKIIIEKKITLKKNPLNFPLFLFLLSQIIATIFTLDRYTSLWGYYSRFHGGLLSTLCYSLLFLDFVNNFPKKKIKTLLIVSFISSTLVCLYAILEHFGIDQNYWVQDVQSRVFSTLGQPNWLAAYIAVIIPQIFFIFNLKTPFFSFLFSFIFTLTILYTKSRSGFIAFWLTISLFWISLFLSSQKRVIFSISLLLIPLFVFSFFLKNDSAFLLFWGGNLLLWTIILFSHQEKSLRFSLGAIFLASFLAIIIAKLPITQLNSFKNIFLTENIGQIEKIPVVKNTAELDTGITESGEIRKIIWKGALDIATHYPLFGTGVESFAYSYNLYRPVEHNMTSEWDFLYNKAHNEYLNILANTGLFGLFSYLLFIIVFIIWVIRKNLEKDHNPQFIILNSLFAGWLSILISNFFGFSVVIIGLIFFLYPALALKLFEKDEKIANQKIKSLNHNNTLILAFLLFLFLLLLYQIVNIWRADYFYALGMKYSKEQNYIQAYLNFQKALKRNSLVPLYYSEKAVAESALASSFAENKEASASSQLKEEAILDNQIALNRSPNNVAFWKNSLKVYYELAKIDERYIFEILTALKKAQELSPTDPKIPYNLAVFLGRLGENKQAITYLKKSLQLKPNYKEAHFAISIFYLEENQKEMAIKHLQEILKKIDPHDLEAQKKLTELTK